MARAFEFELTKEALRTTAEGGEGETEGVSGARSKACTADEGAAPVGVGVGGVGAASGCSCSSAAAGERSGEVRASG